MNERRGWMVVLAVVLLALVGAWWINSRGDSAQTGDPPPSVDVETSTPSDTSLETGAPSVDEPPPGEPPVEDLGPVALTAHVQDGLGRPVAGATVRLQGGDGGASSTTGPDGSVRFREKQCEGVTAAAASAPGFTLQTRELGGLDHVVFTLRSGADLRVIVRDLETGAPVDRADVHVRDFGMGGEAIGRTDARGIATLPGLTLGQKGVLVQAPGRAKQSQVVVLGPGGAEMLFDLEIGWTAFGVVHLDGEPAPGVRVWIGRSARLPVHPVTTDAEGRYELPGLVGPPEVILVGDDVGRRLARFVKKQASGSRHRFDFEFAGSFSLQGRVVADGHPVADAAVRLVFARTMSTEHPREVRTGDDGRFRLSCRPTTGRPPGLNVEAPGYAPRYVQLPGSQPEEPLEIELTPATLVVGELRVNGESVKSGYISLRGRDSDGGRHQGNVQIDSSGRFSLPLHAGTYRGRIDSPEGRYHDLEELAVEGVTLDLGVIDLEPGASLGGVVQTSDGAPVPGAKISVESAADRQNNVWDWTAPDGAFLLRGLPAGLLTVYIDAAGFERLYVENVEAGTADHAFVMKSEDAVIVNVTGPDGKPCPRFTYELFFVVSRPRGGLMPAMTRKAGSGRGRDGRSVLHGQSRGARSIVVRSADLVALADFTVAGEPEVVVPVRLEAGHTASGSVMQSDGQPAVGALVSLMKLKAPGHRYEMKARTDERGRFSFAGAMAGDWRLTIDAKGSPVRHREIRIRAGPPNRFDERLAAGGIVEVRLTSASVDEFRPTRIELRDANDGFVHVTSELLQHGHSPPRGERLFAFGADQNGVARATNVDPGTYTVLVRTRDRRTVRREVTVADGDTVVIDVDIDPDDDGK